VVEVDPRWTWEDPAEADVALLGRPPHRSMVSPVTAVLHVLRRERFLAVVTQRPPTRLLLRDIHRLAPPPGRAGTMRNAVRNALLGGLLIHFERHDQVPTILDAAARDAGVAVRAGSFKPGSDRAAVARVQMPTGEDAILRIAPAATPSDPAQAAGALTVLEAAGISKVPRIRGRGLTAESSWVVESVLPGSRAQRVNSEIFSQVVALCATFPSEARPPTALAQDLEALARRFPRWAPAFEEIERNKRPVVSSLPGVLRHGDLWPGNVLMRGSQLSGLIDWDSWHVSSVPGVDLLQLFIARRRPRARRSLSDVYRAQPWRSQSFVMATRSYWRALGIDATQALLDTVALAWWAGRARGALDRHERLAGDPLWVTRNIDAVLGLI
jgi:Phosphotransferase enzyme family